MTCPSCMQDTDLMWLTYSWKYCYIGHRQFLPPTHIWRKKKIVFNDSTKHRGPPTQLFGEDIINEMQNIGVNVEFDKGNKKWKHTMKISIFFQLSHWSRLKIQYNLDVIHIENNIYDNILETMMNTPEKIQDHVNARRDLANLNIMNELHLV